MLPPFSRFLLEQNWIAVVRAVLRSPRSLRELVDICEISPGGIQDILRRLCEAGVLRAERSGKKTRYRAELSSGERSFLERAIEENEREALRTRAAEYSRRSPRALNWIDETLTSVRSGKRVRRDPA